MKKYNVNDEIKWGSKPIFLILLLTTLCIFKTFSQNKYEAKLEGELGTPKCKLVMINSQTKEKVKDTVIKFFEIVAYDSTSKGEGRGIDAKTIDGNYNVTVFCFSDSTWYIDYKKWIWDKLPCGHYYICFHTILCGLANEKGTFDNDSFGLRQFRVYVKK